MIHSPWTEDCPLESPVLYRTPLASPKPLAMPWQVTVPCISASQCLSVAAGTTCALPERTRSSLAGITGHFDKQDWRCRRDPASVSSD